MLTDLLGALGADTVPCEASGCGRRRSARVRTHLAALGHRDASRLVLVIEGILPFLSPVRFRQALLQFAAVEDRPMRIVGLVCMLVGVLILNAVK